MLNARYIRNNYTLQLVLVQIWSHDLTVKWYKVKYPNVQGYVYFQYHKGIIKLELKLLGFV